MSDKNNEATQDTTGLLELGKEVTIGNYTIPVVDSLDDLPRRKRRELQALMTAVGTDKRGVMAGIFVGAADFAVAYAASQGVYIDLDDESIPLEDQDVIDRETMLFGLRLTTHFTRDKGGKGKASKSPQKNSKSSKTK